MICFDFYRRYKVLITVFFANTLFLLKLSIISSLSSVFVITQKHIHDGYFKNLYLIILTSVSCWCWCVLIVFFCSSWDLLGLLYNKCFWLKSFCHSLGLRSLAGLIFRSTFQTLLLSTLYIMSRGFRYAWKEEPRQHCLSLQKWKSLQMTFVGILVIEHNYVTIFELKISFH